MMRRTLLVVVALAAAGCDIFLPDMATLTPPDKPAISLTGAPLTFTWTLGTAGNPASKVVSITNSGGGTLATPVATASYARGSGWLTLTPSTSGTGFNLTVQPVMTSITASGSYSATVSVASAGATNTPQTFGVTLTVSAPTTPVLAANPTSLTFSYTLAGTTPTPQTVALSNAGGGSMAMPTLSTISYGAGASGWLSASLTGTNLSVGIYTTPFGSSVSGTFTATIAVVSSNATNSPLVIPVSITVTGTPSLALSQSTVYLAAPYLAALPPIGTAAPPGATISASITVSNSGTGVLDVPVTTISYGSNPGWLSARVAAPTSTAPYAVQLTLTPQASYLPVSTYTATVSIDCPGAVNTPLTASVSYTVTSQASPVVVVLSGSTVVTGATFSALSGTVSPSVQSFTLFNAGGGALATPSVAVPPAASSWLSAAVTGTGPTYTLTLTPTGSAVSTPGIYSTSLPIVSPGAVNSGILFAVRLDTNTNAVRSVNVTRIGQYFPGDGTSSTSPIDDVTSMLATTGSGSSIALSKLSAGNWSGSVPTGPYVLEVDFTSGTRYFFEEDASTVDVGFMVAARSAVTAATRSTVATFHLTGLLPWTESSDYLQVSSVSARLRKFWDPGTGITAGATSTNTAALDWFKDANTVSPAALNLLVAGDNLTVNQFRWTDINTTDGYYRSVAGGRITSTPAMTDGSPATITLSLATAADATATYNWTLSAFESALLGAVDQLEHWTTIETYPAHTTTPDLLFNGTVGAVTELEYYPTRRGADLNTTLTYGRFLTSGVVERRKVECDGIASRSYPGATKGVDFTVYVYNEETLNTGVIQPLVGPVSYVSIAGKSASLPSTASGIGTTPLVTWVQPQLGTPSHNVVSFYELGTDASNVTTSKFIGSYYTKAVACAAPNYCLGAIKVPAAMGLTVGKYYVMEIETDAAGPSYSITSPFDRGQPYGEANFVSEVFTP